MLTLRRAAATLVLALPAPALAQTPAATPPAPSAPLGRVDGSRLVPGRWAYDQSVVMGAQRQPVGRRTLSLAPVTYRGAAAWLIVDETDTPAARMTDSLYVARADLTPLHREMTAVSGPNSARLINDFRTDSITGTMIGPGGTIPIALRNRAGVIANSGQLELMLRALPLRAGWRARADVLVPAGVGAGTVPVEIALTGEERVTTPEGDIDSWTASVRGQGGEQRLWIDKASRRLVKMSSTTPMAPGAVVEMVLAPAAAPDR